jgi:hypothetical protein
MTEHTIDLGPPDEDVFAFQYSDEAIEAASGTNGAEWTAQCACFSKDAATSCSNQTLDPEQLAEARARVASRYGYVR